jgi:PAS domain S-box-containing protein
VTLRTRISHSPAWRLLLEPLTMAGLFALLSSIFLFIQHALLPGQKPLFFPPAGLALAIFMMRGWRAIPVVLLGTLVLNLAQPDANHSLPVLTAMTLGPTVQAALAAWLIGRWGGLGAFATPVSAQRMRTMTPLHLGAIVAALMTLISTLAPGMGAVSLLLSGEADRALAIVAWQSGWLGSLAGMLAWGPLLFFAALSWGKVTLPRDPIIFCLAGLIAGAGLMVFAIIQLSERRQQLETLNADAQEITNMHNGLTQSQITQVVALKAFMESSQHVTADDFETFAAQLLANDPVTKTLSWITQVPDAERGNFERQLQQPGAAKFAITDKKPDGTLAAAPRRDVHFPITFVTPRLPYRPIVGMDMAQEAVRRELVEHARDSGDITASAPVHLRYNNTMLPAVLTAMPVYRPSMPLTTVAQRQQAFRGVVLSIFEPHIRLADIRTTLRATATEFFVFDLGHYPDATPAQLIAWSSPNAHQAPPLDLDLATLRQGSHAESRFSFAGRQRLMIVRANANAKVIAHRFDSSLVLVFSWLLSGTLLYFMGRREAQDQSLRQSNDLRHEEAMFTRQLLEQLPIGVAVRNRQGDVMHANSAFCALLGRSLAQTHGLGNAQITAPEFVELDAAQTKILESTGAYGPYEKEYLHADGSKIPVLVRGLHTEWNGLPVILSVAEDISARRKSAFQLAQSQKMDAIGQLTGGLAHDFNNMLGVIIGNLDLLTRSLSGNTAAQVKLDTALTAALRGADLTGALLTVARSQTVRTEPVNLSSRLQELLPLVRHTAGKMIEVSLKLAGHPVVEIDPGGLASTVLNLVLNARDAMPEGGHLTLATQLRVIHADNATLTLKPGQYAELSVTDTGSGMRPEVLVRVLEPFFTTKERGRGTGLGLSMAHGFIKQCGGDLLIESEPGHGTMLRLMLPIAAQRPVTGTSIAPTDARSITPALLPRGYERVLVVDDELELLAVTAIWLKELGYEVTPCISPASALAALQDGAATGCQYALMVTDIIMPGIDGFALAKAARAIHPSLALLYVSGFADTTNRESTRPDGPVLEKPFRQPALATLVRQTLDYSSKDTP